MRHFRVAGTTEGHAGMAGEEPRRNMDSFMRERPVDIPRLGEMFVHDLSARWTRSEPTIARETMGALVAHAWPTNARGLIYAMERALATRDGQAPLPEHLTGALLYADHVAAVRPISAYCAFRATACREVVLTTQRACLRHRPRVGSQHAGRRQRVPSAMTGAAYMGGGWAPRCRDPDSATHGEWR